MKILPLEPFSPATQPRERRRRIDRGRVSAQYANALVESPESRVEGRGSKALVLCQELRDHFAADVRQAEVPALELVGELRVVQAHQVKDGGVQVVDVDRVFDHVVAEIVGAGRG